MMEPAMIELDDLDLERAQEAEFAKLPEFDVQASRLLKIQHSKKDMDTADVWSNRVSLFVGTWSFLTANMVFVAIWLLVMNYASNPIDPVPYPLLNLILSFEAEFSAPFIVMAQRTGDSVDRWRIASIRNQANHMLYLLGLCRQIRRDDEVDPGFLQHMSEALKEAEYSALALNILIEKSKSELSGVSPCWQWVEDVQNAMTDWVSHHIRSWRYIFLLVVFFIFWLAWNGVDTAHSVDPAPYFGLSLTLTILAAINAPLIMMSTLRQAALDRRSVVSLQLEVNNAFNELKELVRMRLREYRARGLSFHQPPAPFVHDEADSEPASAACESPPTDLPQSVCAQAPDAVALGGDSEECESLELTETSALSAAPAAAAAVVESDAALRLRV